MLPISRNNYGHSITLDRSVDLKSAIFGFTSEGISDVIETEDVSGRCSSVSGNWGVNVCGDVDDIPKVSVREETCCSSSESFGCIFFLDLPLAKMDDIPLAKMDSGKWSSKSLSSLKGFNLW